MSRLRPGLRPIGHGHQLLEVFAVGDECVSLRPPGADPFAIYFAVSAALAARR